MSEHTPSDDVSYEESRQMDDSDLIKWAFAQPQRLVRELAIRYDALIEKYHRDMGEST